MFRIDNATAAAAPPAAPAAGTEGYFTGGDPAIGTPATIVEAWFLNMLQSELEGVVTGAGLAPDKANNGQLYQAIQALIAAGITPSGHGECRLGLSGANLLLSPFNGQKLIINGVVELVPDVGLTLAPTGLAIDTVFYIYAYMTAGVMSLEASTTVPATNTDGVRIKSADATRSLVGMARTIVGPAWSTSDTEVLSWFHRRPKRTTAVLTANRTTSSTAYVELDASARVGFCAFPGDTILAWATGAVANNGTVSDMAVTSIGVDGLSPVESFSEGRADLGGWPDGFAVIDRVSATLDYHYATLLGHSTGQPLDWLGSAVAGARCSLNVEVLG